MYHERMKHIDVRYHFIRDVFEEGDINVQKVSIVDNATDVMTKSLTVSKFRHYLDLISCLDV